MKPLDQLAQNIRSARKTAGLTQDDVAGLLGFNSTTSYIRWERGSRTPTVGNLVRLSAALDTTLAALLDGVGPQVDGDEIDEALRLLRSMTTERRAAAVRVLREFSAT